MAKDLVNKVKSDQVKLAVPVIRNVYDPQSGDEIYFTDGYGVDGSSVRLARWRAFTDTGSCDVSMVIGGLGTFDTISATTSSGPTQNSLDDTWVNEDESIVISLSNFSGAPTHLVIAIDAYIETDHAVEGGSGS